MYKNTRLEEILASIESTRNDDKLLFVEYLKKFYCQTEIEKAIIERVILSSPAQSSLVRQRAFFQNNLGKYKADKSIRERRELKSQRMREEFRSDKTGFWDAVGRYFRKLTK